MRKLFLFLIAYLILVNTSNAQEGWLEQNSGTSDPLKSICFINENTGWVVGGYPPPYGSGPIRNTTDGGYTWAQQILSTQVLHSVSFVDQYGWVVGTNKIIYHTIDGGTNWDVQIFGGASLYSVYFLDQAVGTAVGQGGTILRTTNGGTHWHSQTSGSDASLRGISYADSLNGTAVGYDGFEGTILRTTDGGTIWNTQPNAPNQLFGITFIDQSTGWIVGNYDTILKTTDGGATWISQHSGIDKSFRSVYFINKNVGWIVGWDGIVTLQNLLDQILFENRR